MHLTNNPWHRTQSVYRLDLTVFVSHSIVLEAHDHHELLRQILHAQVAGTIRPNLSPGQFTLLAFLRSPKAEAMNAAIAVVLRKSECRLLALIAFDASGQRLARTLACLVTSNDLRLVLNDRTVAIAAAPLTQRIFKIPNGAAIAAASGVALAANALTAVQITGLTNSTL